MSGLRASLVRLPRSCAFHLRLVTAATSAAASLALSSELLAQPDPKTPGAADSPNVSAHQVVPPRRVLSDTHVEYPEQASGDADVILELVVGADGQRKRCAS